VQRGGATRIAPRGWADAGLQLALFAGAYYAYQLVRGLAAGQDGAAFANAERVIELERALGSYFEPGFQDALLGHEWLVSFANFFYLNSHFVVTSAFLVWLYLFRVEHFPFVRNMFCVAMALALVGYAAFPTAPPRLLPHEGFTDTIAAFTGVPQDSQTIGVLVNRYAAVPSMHTAFALLVAAPALSLARGAAARAWWSAYPLLVVFAIVATGNHFWFDAAAGAAVACAAALAARELARLRPERWAWPSEPGRVTA
jgi:hypothetical protein